ncbi:MAG: M28 family peptidase [Actinomycetota bacterium]
MRPLLAAPAIALLLCVACDTLPEGQRSDAPVTGPPEVEVATIERHARQFDEEEPVREAGSQEELAASAYMVAHVTDAGYVFRLDAVPVADLVRSTNVVALPPSGAEPAAIVVTGYDSTAETPPNGRAIGVWLEVARALRVVDREHSVEFVALGAEETDLSDGRLGSRRLAQQLSDDAVSPPIVVVGRVSDADGAAEVAGADGAAVRDAGKAAGVRVRVAPDRVASSTPTAGVFAAAGFDTTVVSGAAEPVARVLLAYLTTL